MNKLLVISGGSRGIGRAILEKFASQGFDVITCGRSTADLTELATETAAKYPAVQLLTYVSDVSKKEEVFSFIDAVKALNRPIDVLVNNAGFFAPGQIANEADGVFESQFNTNVASAYHLTRGFVNDMVDRKDGYIFNICSTASITAYTNGGSYCISKFALLGMSKVLREELKSTCVRVTSVLPGATFTSSWEGSGLPEDRFMQAQDVADMVLNTYNLPKTSVVEEILMRPQLGDL